MTAAPIAIAPTTTTVISRKTVREIRPGHVFPSRTASRRRDDRRSVSVDGRAWNRLLAGGKPWSSLGRGTTYWLRIRVTKVVGQGGPAVATPAGATSEWCAGATEIGAAPDLGAWPAGLAGAIDLCGAVPADGAWISRASVAIAPGRATHRRHSATPAAVNRPQIWHRERAGRRTSG